MMDTRNPAIVTPGLGASAHVEKSELDKLLEDPGGFLHELLQARVASGNGSNTNPKAEIARLIEGAPNPETVRAIVDGAMWAWFEARCMDVRANRHTVTQSGYGAMVTQALSIVDALWLTTTRRHLTQHLPKFSVWAGQIDIAATGPWKRLLELAADSQWDNHLKAFWLDLACQAGREPDIARSDWGLDIALKGMVKIAALSGRPERETVRCVVEVLICFAGGMPKMPSSYLRLRERLRRCQREFAAARTVWDQATAEVLAEPPSGGGSIPNSAWWAAAWS